MSAAWVLTMGGVSVPGVELSGLGSADINDETPGAEIGGDTVPVDASVVANTAVGT
jgi:hypothetical protein